MGSKGGSLGNHSDEVEHRKRAIDAVASALDVDVLLYNGPILRPVDIKMHTACRQRDKRKNVLLVLVTEGGDPDAAYRISRCLQEHYEKFTCIVPGWCKSAGTLIAIGAHELVFTGAGELGPLDVQMSKRDDLIEMQSGQTVVAALSSLQEKAFSAFQQFFLEMQVNSGGRITLRTAADLAATLTIGLLSPLYRQIDPMQVGEAGRASSIAQQYGMRLDESAKNLKTDALNFLISGYSNHGFVIDMKEATKLFHRVRPANQLENDFIELLGDWGLKPMASVPRIEFLSDGSSERASSQRKEKTNGKSNDAITPSTSRTRKAPQTAGGRGAPNGINA